MPALLNPTQTQLGPITEPIFDFANAVGDHNGQIPGTFPTAIFMYGLASGLTIMISIFCLLVVLFDQYSRRENLKLVRFGTRFPNLQEGDKFSLEQENGMIYEGVVTLKASDFYEIKSDEGLEQESSMSPFFKLKQAEIQDDRDKAKREIRTSEEEHEYQAFMEHSRVYCYQQWFSKFLMVTDTTETEGEGCSKTGEIQIENKGWKGISSMLQLPRYWEATSKW
ncbi:hypothetical protein BGAL_0134g00200 [Botrytis galanthina]|uniref:Uncharacterized protein n=1 Tax=Botrytis galanthina TaxID=278940 RepID=A0A4S8QZJ6_9HELO|nr:hypothetical protein BGAL_0134g00200 [Botrytis galanthina]